MEWCNVITFGGETSITIGISVSILQYLTIY